MGRRIDALLGKMHLNTSKFNPIIKLAISRLSILKNQRQARHSISHSDVVQLLNLGQQHRALLRVEQVIKEQSMLDVFAMIEGYCIHLVDKVDLVKKQSVCPHELDEVISSLIYAASRCGEFPELQKIRSILTSQFGKEYAGRATELHNDCRVNRKMVQKLSMRQPSLENRLKVLNEIASANGITLQNEEELLTITEEKLGVTERDPPMNSHVPNLQDNYPIDENTNSFSDSMKVRRKYKDAADAAQASFEFAAHAATAARAAVELSRSESYDPDDHSSPDSRPRNMFSIHEPIQNEFRTGPQMDSQGIEERSFEMEYNQFHSSQSYRSIPDDEETHIDIRDEGSKQNRNTSEINASVSGSSSDSDSADKLLETTFSPNIEGHTTTSEKEIYFDDRDDKNDKEQVGMLLSENYYLDHSLLTETVPRTESSSTANDKVKDILQPNELTANHHTSNTH